MSFSDRLQHAWNAFMGRDPTALTHPIGYGGSLSHRDYKMYFSPTTERTIVNTVYTRIALDCAAYTFQHVQCDQNGSFKSIKDSMLNNCLSMRANIDQLGRVLIKDLVYSMCEEGVVAVVPIDTNINPKTGSFDIETMRVGQITEWYPQHVKVKVYNEQTGKKQEVIFPKKSVAIIENPFYEIMNAPNSTLKRLVSKMALLDMTDSKNSSGKLDLIIQFPYIVKGETKIKQAEARRKLLEDQLTGSKYGIAYADGTEKIIQLNKSLENNLYEQVKDLKQELFNELGLTENIFNGTADEATLLNYSESTLKPILETIALEFKSKFLSTNARTRGQSIMFFKNPFSIVPVSQLAEIADKFTRNEIMSSNEFRSVIGYKPVDDPRADELRNKNLNASNEELANPMMTTTGEEGAGEMDSNEYQNM